MEVGIEGVAGGWVWYGGGWLVVRLLLLCSDDAMSVTCHLLLGGIMSGGHCHVRCQWPDAALMLLTGVGVWLVCVVR